jgi:hypothetical protein
MRAFNELNKPLVYDKEEGDRFQEEMISQIIKEGEKKKQRVVRFLGSNIWPIEKIVEKFGLSHDVIKDHGNGLVKMAFYSDESMRVVCFYLTMPYSEVLERLDK